MKRYAHEAFFTTLMAAYSLSFALVDRGLLRPSAVVSLVSLAFFPVFVLVGRLLKKGPLKRNLFLPLDIALMVSTVMNAVSFGDVHFFAVMFVIQIFILAMAFVWSAYEFVREGRTLQFVLSFAIWFSLVVLTDAFL